MRRPALLRSAATALLALAAVLPASRCLAWGETGHEIVALIAEHYLTPATRQRVAAVLASAAPTEPIPTPDIRSAASWADRYRDSDREGAGLRYRQTRRWHYVNLDLRKPDLERACFGHPPLKPGQLAARGPARACIVDKLEQFRREWLAPETPPAERLLALRFLLHFAGDLHQPLHASDNDDHGGNKIAVSGPGNLRATLHSFWDTAVVRELGRDPDRIARRLVGRITPAQREQWQRGTAADWARESHAVAVADVYGKLPPAGAATDRNRTSYRLSDAYMDQAETVAALQLSRAGVRLARLLEPDGH